MDSKTKKAVIFFGCSMRGGHSIVNCEELAEIPMIIEELGFELVSKHQTGKDVLRKENLLTKTEIHDRDYNWLLKSHYGVFEISNPSLGVGSEISDMVHNNKPVLCVFKKGLEQQVSAYILGKQGSKFFKNVSFECHPYDSLEELRSIIRDFIHRHCAEQN